MGKSHCLYCGASGNNVRLAYQEAPDLYICEDCYDQQKIEQGSEEPDVNLFGEQMNKFEVTFHLISGYQITLSETTPDITAGDYTRYLISNPYSIFYDDDGHTVVVNMANVTSFNVHKKEKEE